MPKATLTKRIEFCASHRYHNPAWDEATNRRVFGPCNNVYGHGHNYLLEVTLWGDIDPVTGMIINIYDLKQYVWEVLEAFDHKHLNLDTPYFQQMIPTTENLAHVLWQVFSRHPQIPPLDRIRLYEDDDFFADVTAEHRCQEEGLLRACVTRLYRLSASYRADSSRLFGHDYVVGVTVEGVIHPDTGMVVNLSELDTLVDQHVIQRFHGRELNQDPAFHDQPIAESSLAEVIWHLLAHHIRIGFLARVTVRGTRDSEACYQPEQTGAPASNSYSGRS